MGNFQPTPRGLAYRSNLKRKGFERNPYKNKQFTYRKPERELPPGKQWCSRHPNTYYDPRRYPCCYLCYQEQKQKGGSNNG